MDISGYLNKKPDSFFVAAGTVLVLLISIPDYLIGRGVGFSIFFLFPVLIAAWYASRAAAIYMASLGAAVWLLVDELSGNPYGMYVPVWNMFVRLIFFLIVVFLIDSLKLEKTSARQDYLTELGNRRNFIERADAEIKRAQRYGHPFAVAYIDIDDFKSVNDRFGHAEGDSLLKSVAAVIKGNIRATDIEARLGGDEFSVLLPESDAESAAIFFTKLHGLLSRILISGRVTVTFSIGVVTFLTPPETVDVMIKTVDAVMYSAKEGGKNAVRFSVVSEAHK